MSGPVIAITVHNRPAYLKQTLESWAMARGIGKAEMIFRCEPGTPEAVALCEQVTFARKTQVIVNPERYGVLANPWHALNTAFATGASFVIAGEEDVTVSDDVIEFFAWAQREYEADPHVAAVCAYQYDTARPAGGGEDADVVRDHHFSPLVWGTWAGRWENLFRDSWDFDYRRHGWDYNVQRLMTARGMCIVMPVLSRCQHIGELGGQHCSPDFFPETVAASFREQFGQPSYREVPGAWAPPGEALPPDAPVRINLGAGSVIEPGWVNHDLVALPGIGVVHDLNSFPWPWPDGVAERVKAYDVFEHVWEPLPFMRECWRILRPGGILDMQTVHYESPNYHTDPDHKRGCTEESWDYWIPGTGLFARYGAAYAQGCHFAKISVERTPGMDIAVILRKVA